MRAPDFWSHNGFAATALAPLGALYALGGKLKQSLVTPYRARARVLCIGNVTLGGAGKTPTSLACAQILMRNGAKVFFLTRGYGGALSGPILVSALHTAADVGDEALLLRCAAPVIVARDRAAGARLADAQGADIIVMDDGFQNPSLAKDMSLLVVDAAAGFGNGRIFPAGPLRENLLQAFARAQGVIAIGSGPLSLGEASPPVFRTRLDAADTGQWRGARVLAFAGIGRPQKFFDSLMNLGAEIVVAREFPDHHVYAENELAELRAIAERQKLLLVTTEKDFVRLKDFERNGISTLPVQASFDDEAGLTHMLDSCFRTRESRA